MWPWLIGGAVAVLILLRSSISGAGAASASRFVYVDKDGVQRVTHSEAAQVIFDAEMERYHVFGVGVETLSDGSFAIRGKRDVGETERLLPRLYPAVVAQAGPDTLTGTFMAMSDVDALLSGKKPQAITVYISPREMTKAKAREGSQFVALD